MANQSNNQVPPDDGEPTEIKPDIHQSMGSKKLQEEFDYCIQELTSKIGSLNS